MYRKSFLSFLQSPIDEIEWKHWYRKEWAGIKQKVWEEAKIKGCWICGKGWGLQYHHLSYLRIDTAHEWKDIVIVCRLHHRLCHFTLLGKVPMNSKDLTARYKYLLRHKWRRFKPSMFFDWLIYAYGIGGNQRLKRRSWQL